MINILQLTDTHLLADRQGEMFGVNTYSALQGLLKSIQARINSVEYIFLTGDVSQDMSVESYQHVIKLLEPLQKPIYWIAGNHDDKKVMADAFNDSPLFHPLDFLRLGDWGFFMLDTVAANEDKGYLQEETLTRNIPAVPYLACMMHHHPIDVGGALIDKYKLQNTELLLPFFSKQNVTPNLIITGHVHGAYQTKLMDIPVISSPATCFQFSKGTNKLAIDKISGCTFWQFENNGSFEFETVFC